MQGNNFTSAIRTVGSALVIAAVLMTFTFQTVIHHLMLDSVPYALSMAIWTLSPVSGTVAGLNMFFPAIVVLGYIGVSLWLATILHEFVEGALAGIKEVVGQLYRRGATIRRT
ncbi:TPA: hypothetical protein ACYLN4_000553 [Burkholderia lata]